MLVMLAIQKPIDNYIFEDIYKVEEEYKNTPAICYKGISYTFDELDKSVDYFASLLL